MKYILLYIVLIFTSCNLNYRSEKHIGSASNSTTDASELFFNNVRQPYYFVEEFPEKHLKIYTLKTFKKDHTGYPVPSIHMNWRDDLAFLYFNLFNEEMLEESLQFKWVDQEEQTEGLFRSVTGREDHTGLADSISKHLKKEHSVFMKQGAGYIPIYTDKAEIRSFMTTYSDFLRLIEKK
jgi:hypothetical protein